MTIGNIIESRESGIFSAIRGETIGEVASRLAQNRIGAMPVVENGTVIGMISERDIIYGLAANGASILAKTVGDVMTAPAITVSSDTTILSALSLMTRRRIRHLPVIDGGVIAGFVSIGDLVKHRIEKIEAEANAMRNYIQMV
jgi:CBS domain-containing protein